jgi:hypothetical protein
MAAVPVSMQVIIYPKNKTVAPYPATIVGYAWITGLGVDVSPPDQQPPSLPPGKPTFPIWGPPGIELPPVPGYPPVASHPLPEPPPDLPTNPPDDNGWIKPPPPGGGWGFHSEHGWVYVYKPGEGQAGPKK